MIREERKARMKVITDDDITDVFDENEYKKTNDYMVQIPIEERVPAWVHEREMTRADTDKKRWFIISIIIFICFCLTNAFWIVREMSYEDVVVTETTQDVDQSSDAGNNSFVGGDLVGETEG